MPVIKNIAEFRKFIASEFTPTQQKVLLALCQGCSVSDACKAAKKTDKTYYNWYDKKAGFREAAAIAKQLSVEVFENLLDVCAKKAITDARYTRSLEFLLKARARDVYGDVQKVEQVGNKQPLVVQLTTEGVSNEQSSDAVEQGQSTIENTEVPAAAE